MLIEKVNLTHTKNGKTVLSARLVLDSGKSHLVYFEIDQNQENFACTNANAFLPVALPIAMKRNESLKIEDSVSKRLLGNVPKIQKILSGWEKLDLKKCSVQAESADEKTKLSSHIGCYFSGGVDSFFTYLKNRSKIDCLVFVHGFDIGTADVSMYKRVERNILNIAASEKIKLIRVKTNVREIFEQYLEWDVAHEFALAAVSLFLSKGLKGIYVSCGLPNKNKEHGYLDPELDQLWSTESMDGKHFGCEFDKIAKVEYLANFQIAMDNLRVCWMNKSRQYNCCECEKCLRNMLALYSCGALSKCKSFNKEINSEKLRKTRVGDYVLKYFDAIADKLDDKHDQSEIRQALEDFIDSNKNPSFSQKTYGSVRDFIGQWDQKHNSSRLFWYLSKRGVI